MAADASLPRSRLGRYELIARLATGGMGEIFLAHLEGAEGFEKIFVVKRILPHLADDARFRQMLIAEARIASKLSHPNICQVYELGEEGGQLYIVMEYLDGVSLLALVKKASRANQPLDLGLVGGIIQQASDALHYAHDLRDRGGEPMGLVHRDVTPGNLFVTESGVAKLLDFGIAKAKGATANTQTGAVKGKYAYMAPEQLRGGDVDRRVDVFALGVVLYEMLALRRLFHRNTDYLTFRAVMEQPIPDVRRYRADAPDALAGAIARALDRATANRFDTARQFASAVLDALASANRRPWTQGEISDYIRNRFQSDLARRSAQLAIALRSDSPAKPQQVGRSTMPLLVDADEARVIEVDDDDVPSVDTDVGDPPEGAQPSVGTFRQSTPQPFAAPNDPTGSGLGFHSLKPLQAPQVAQAPTVVVAPQRRSFVWPVIAIAAVLVAGGAVVLVYLNMANRQPPQVIITQGSNNPVVAATVPQDAGVTIDAPAVATPPPADAALTVDAGRGTNGTGGGGTGGGGGKPQAPPLLVKYTRVISARLGDITSCVRDHGGTAPPQAAHLIVGVDGKAKSISLAPDALNASPAGECIRNILAGVTFPMSDHDVEMQIPFVSKST